MTRTRRALALALGTGLLSLAPAAPALAAPTPAATTASVCTIRLVSLTANDLQEEGDGRDEIFVKFNDTRFRLDGNPVYFYDNTTRPALAFGNPAEDFFSSVKVKVIEDDPIVNDTIGDPVVLSCTARDNFPIVFHGGGAVYTMVVDVVPA